MTTRPYRSVACTLLVLHLQACMTWRPADPDPAKAIVQGQPKEVRITKRDGTQVVVREPTLVRDSIMSFSRRCEASATGDRTSSCVEDISPQASLVEVSLIEVRGLSAGRTIAAVLVLPAAIVVVTFLGYALGDPQGLLRSGG